MQAQAERNEWLLDIAIHVGLIAVWSVVALLLLWPLGHVAMVLGFLRSFVVFWLLAWLVSLIFSIVLRAFRINMYQRSTAYIILGLLVGGVLCLCWAAAAALLAGAVAAYGPWWLVLVAYALAVLATWIALSLLARFFSGQIYALANLGLAVIGLVVFGFWPGVGRTMFGWLLPLFGV